MFTLFKAIERDILSDSPVDMRVDFTQTILSGSTLSRPLRRLVRLDMKQILDKSFRFVMRPPTVSLRLVRGDNKSLDR